MFSISISDFPTHPYMHYLGHTYTKNVSVIYLKFRFHWPPLFCLSISFTWRTQWPGSVPLPTSPRTPALWFCRYMLFKHMAETIVWKACYFFYFLVRATHLRGRKGLNCIVYLFNSESLALGIQSRGPHVDIVSDNFSLFPAPTLQTFTS